MKCHNIFAAVIDGTALTVGPFALKQNPVRPFVSSNDTARASLRDERILKDGS